MRLVAPPHDRVPEVPPEDLHTRILLERAKEGQNAAWGEIYRRYTRMLELQVRCHLPAASRDIQNLVQNAFSKAWERISSFQYGKEGCFRLFLTTIIVNECRNLLKHDGGMPTVSSEEAGLADLEDKSEALRRQHEESGEHFLRHMKLLHEDDRNILVMKMEGKSLREIAEILECDEATARSLLGRANSRLSRRLDGRQPPA